MSDANVNIPNCLKDRFSSKAITIASLSALTNILNSENSSEDYQILLLTSYGFIKGDLCETVNIKDSTSIDEATNKTTLDISFILNNRLELISDMEKENPNIKPTDNGATLNLKNVKIYKDNLLNPILTLGQMLVFVDKIIGIYLIPRDHN